MFSLFERLELETALPEDHDDIVAEGSEAIEKALDHLDELEEDPGEVPFKTRQFTVELEEGEQLTYVAHDGDFHLSSVEGSAELKQAFATNQLSVPHDSDVRTALRSLMLTLQAAPRTPHGRKN